MRFKDNTFNILNAFWAIPFVILVRLLRPIFFIRFTLLRSNRIGHFVADSVQLMILNEKKNQNLLRLLSFKQPSSNNYWETRVKKNLKIRQWSKYLFYWNWKIPGGEKHNEVFQHSRDFEGNLEISKFRLDFSSEEDLAARNWLKRKGWKEGEPFVCLLVRDSAYLRDSALIEDHDWSYHDYRDTDIKDYVPAMEWLTEQGVFVLRMGKIMKEQIKTRNKMIIDYAFLDDKSDFMDIWLFANCALCISTGTGPDLVSDVYRRPLLFLNCIPLGNIISWSNSMQLPKNLYWKKNSKELTLKEHLKYTSHTNIENSKEFKQEDLSQEEILDSVKECWSFLQGSSKFTKEEEILNKKFWRIIKSDPEVNKIHGWIHPKARIGMSWLKSRKDTFLK